MTCIVALKTPTSIAIAGDGLTVAGDRIVSRTTKKYVELSNGWIIANSGLSSFRDLLARREDLLALYDDVYSLCASIRSYLKEVGYNSTPSSQQGVGLPSYDLGIAIINRGVPNMIVCRQDGSVVRDEENPWTAPPGIWVASGGDIWPKEMEIGRPYGLGSGESHGEAGAWVAHIRGSSPLEAVILGVKSAIEYDLNSGGEIWSLEMAL